MASESSKSCSSAAGSTTSPSLPSHLGAHQLQRGKTKPCNPVSNPPLAANAAQAAQVFLALGSSAGLVLVGSYSKPVLDHRPELMWEWMVTYWLNPIVQLVRFLALPVDAEGTSSSLYARESRSSKMRKETYGSH